MITDSFLWEDIYSDVTSPISTSSSKSTLLPSRSPLSSLLPCCHLTCSQLLQARQIAIEAIRVAAVRVRVVELPDCLPRPAARDGANAAGVARQKERACAAEFRCVACALGGVLEYVGRGKGEEINK